MARSRRWVCRCGLGFTYRKQLNEHVRNDHEKIRPRNRMGMVNGKRCVIRRIKITVVEE